MKDFGTAVILCGGRSTRMGFDKSLLKINNEYLIDIIGGQLEQVFDNVILATNSMGKIKDMKYSGVTDLYPDVGPLGGIYTALNYSVSRYVFVTACDMPVINIGYIKYMMETIKRLGADGIISCNGSYFEPLHAFYSVDMLQTIEREIKNKNFKIFDVLGKCRIHYVEDSIVQGFRSEADMFANINYYSDLKLLDKIFTEDSDADGNCEADKNIENYG
ncbi:MAG TPA: molybdenum cofactor guanylyltransferase [Clostridiaceae bacterium]|nr:molybdenum cofactor guanylyltransferase [Clostridiaceae bacterium]